MSELITEVPRSFMEEFHDHIIGNIPAEKVQCELRQARNARIMQQAGSLKIDGVGQKIAEIDPRLWFRMLHSFGHQDNWLDDFLADNPQLCAPGYKPKSSALRHSKSFVGGAPV